MNRGQRTTDDLADLSERELAPDSQQDHLALLGRQGLKNLAERLLIMSGDRITLADLPEQIAAVKSSPAIISTLGTGEKRLPLREFREQVERHYIADTLNENDWNISRTAQILGIERTNLHKKLKTLGISRGDDNEQS